ncbi:periplasmic sugar-binding protein, putative [Pseudoalteromonas luteoviolacea B = ATCC 29581]|nr:periplasmic sugar-binding protein, putative [Pseudoalteromonas luteoviolacea B = ATCC 29581]
MLLVNPSIENDPFWFKVERVAQAAAQQLNIELSIIYGDGNRFAQLEELKKYLEYQAIPDYVVLIHYPGGAIQASKLLSQYPVQFITLEQTISGKEREAIGKPKQYYPNWIGEIYHDNYHAGYELAKALSEPLLQRKLPVYPILLNGHYGSESDARSDGARAYFSSQNIEIVQSVFANWSQEQAIEKTEKLIRRHPEINVIWSASDLMAIGSESAVYAAKLDHTVQIGGFDWLDDVVPLIQNGQINASVGGHFMMAAWALVSLYDHHNKRSYWQNNQELIFDLTVLNQKTMAELSWLSKDHDWSLVDFRALTLTASKQPEYPFIHHFEHWLATEKELSIH